MKKLFNTGVWRISQIRKNVDEEITKAENILERYANITAQHNDLHTFILRKQRTYKFDGTSIVFEIDPHVYAKYLTKLLNRHGLLEHNVETNNALNLTIRSPEYTIQGKKAFNTIYNFLMKHYTTYGSDGFHGLRFYKAKWSISPADILLMSTNQRWTSCTTLENGEYRLTTIAYTQSQFMSILYLYNKDNIPVSRANIYYDGESLQVLRVYGNAVHEILMKSLIRRIIRELELFPPNAKLYHIPHGSFESDKYGSEWWGYSDIPAFVYQLNSHEPILYPYNICDDELYCLACNSHVPCDYWDTKQLVCSDCAESKRKVAYCRHCGDPIYDGDNYIITGSGDIICDYCINMYYSRCGLCYEYVEHTYEVRGRNYTLVVCEECLYNDSSIEICENCGKACTTELTHNGVCVDCQPVLDTE